LSAKRAWLLKTIAFAESAVSKWKFGLFKLSKHLFAKLEVSSVFPRFSVIFNQFPSFAIPSENGTMIIRN
jgi:hypothetical protein